MTLEKAFSINVLTKNSKEHAEIVERDLYAEDFRTYLVLRGVLELFEKRMVEYYLAGETVEERNARAEEIQEAIKDIPNETWKISMAGCTSDEDCEKGQRCINSVCQDIPEERSIALNAFAQSGISEH